VGRETDDKMVLDGFNRYMIIRYQQIAVWEFIMKLDLHVTENGSTEVRKGS
jgi:hypothetical protein